MSFYGDINAPLYCSLFPWDSDEAFFNVTTWQSKTMLILLYHVVQWTRNKDSNLSLINFTYFRPQSIQMGGVTSWMSESWSITSFIFNLCFSFSKWKDRTEKNHIAVFPKWNRNSLNPANSENLIYYWSINWRRYKDPASHMCLAGTRVASWSLTQEVAGLNSPFCKNILQVLQIL